MSVKLHAASAIAAAVLTSGVAIAPTAHAEKTSAPPAGCQVGYFCMYPESLYNGHAKLLRAQDVPATMFGLSVYNATDKCARLYRGAQYAEPHYDVNAHQGWKFVTFRFGSLKFVDCPHE